MILGPITLYTHASSREDYDFAHEWAARQGWTDEQLQHLADFLDLRPLYEVSFDWVLDTDTGDAHCIKVDLGFREGVFTQPYPGQPLDLLTDV